MARFPQNQAIQDATGGLNSKKRVCTSLRRNLLKILTDFRTDDCGLRKQLMTIELNNESDCPFRNDEDETPLHLLLECQAVAYRKLYCLGTYQVEETELPMSRIRCSNSSLGLD